VKFSLAFNSFLASVSWPQISDVLAQWWKAKEPPVLREEGKGFISEEEILSCRPEDSYRYLRQKGRGVYYDQM
jgi:hypothetical protein